MTALRVALWLISRSSLRSASLSFCFFDLRSSLEGCATMSSRCICADGPRLAAWYTTWSRIARCACRPCRPAPCAFASRWRRPCSCRRGSSSADRRASRTREHGPSYLRPLQSTPALSLTPPSVSTCQCPAALSPSYLRPVQSKPQLRAAPSTAARRTLFELRLLALERHPVPIVLSPSRVRAPLRHPGGAGRRRRRQEGVTLRWW